MLSFTVEIRWALVLGVAALASVLSTLYALLLSTKAGREVCARRTYWTVIGGHLLMGLTMAWISRPMAALWLMWSAVCGLPLVVRSLLEEWRWEEAQVAALEGYLRGSCEAGDNCRGGSRHGEDCAGADGSG